MSVSATKRRSYVARPDANSALILRNTSQCNGATAKRNVSLSKLLESAFCRCMGPTQSKNILRAFRLPGDRMTKGSRRVLATAGLQMKRRNGRPSAHLSEGAFEYAAPEQ